MQLRKQMLKYETNKVLGNRKPSTNSRNAFGSRHFQPHISIIKAGSMLQNDLTPIGKKMRDKMKDLHFNKFVIRIKES